MKRILGYAARQWKLYIISIATLVLGVRLEALGPQYVQRIVDECIVAGNTAGFVKALLLPMLLVYLGTGVFNYIQEYSSDCISAACQKVMRMDVYRSIMGKDTAFFRKNNPGELMSRTKQDIETVGFVMGFISLFAAQIIYHIIYIAICIIRISGVASIPAFVAMPVIAFLAIMSEPKGDKLSDKRSDVIADMNQSATESLSGIRTVKAFGREDTERRRFDKHNSMFRYYSRKIDYLWANWETPMSTLARIMLAASILISGIQVIKGNMTLGQLTTIAAYTSELSWPMMEVGWLLAEFSSASASQRKIRAIIEQKPSIVDGEKTLDEVHGNIRFDHVSYEVDGIKIIDDVSFDLQDGKVLGIMGSTGSGKTTLANLAMRFVDPTSGSVSTDGIDLRELDLASARKGKAIVTQDVFLFSDSVKANLEKGQRDKLPMEVMKKAAVDAAADEFVSKLSEGYETVIGEKGVGLSGGQKQRVAIARAFASGRPLLIFDDATSALDMETEKEVQRAIRRKAGCSMMVIAHRISAVKDADEIIFLENGHVAERGTHEQLLAKKGLYWQTYSIQYPDELCNGEAK